MSLKRQTRIALALAASFPACFTGTAYAAVPPGASAEIVSLQGLGDHRAVAAIDWQAAKAAQPLANGAFVRTRESSKMAILFADQTQVRLSQNSILQVKNVGERGSSDTTLMLSLGRAWSQAKRTPDARLNMQTPAATAAIRGTDWELEVGPDGKTMLTVLSGSVEFANEQGSITVARNEAAIAEVGKAPVKLQISNPRDRIQWVNAITLDPLRHLHAADLPPALAPAYAALAKGDLRAFDAALPADAPADWQTVLRAARQMLAGDAAQARATLGTADALPAFVLLRADLDLLAGDYAQAAAVLEAGLQRHRLYPELLAQLARAQLLADRLDDSAATLRRLGDSEHTELLLARGALAHRQGNAPATLAAYGRAVQVAPADDRAWFGLGSAQSEREDTAPARAQLQQAVSLKTDGAGYRGELGTLETFAFRLNEAEAAFSQALRDNPADYVALTGLGLLRLKQNRNLDALDALLRAGVLEPRYARAKTYTAVAYYRMKRHADAISTLKQASELDDKDPVPYLLLSQIHTDLFHAGAAIAASRAAVARMPNLKSLNQLANDQKGSANLGAALAFFGMEDWALELAQQSYYPYWGGSHLFLADRYAGEFNKNSELFQGFLTDPLAFGGSNRHSPLLQAVGHHGSIDASFDKAQYRMSAPSATANGLLDAGVPVSYFVQGQRAIATRFPLDVGVSGVPAFYDPSGSADVRAQVASIGLGTMINARLGLFAYSNEFKARVSGRNKVELFDEDPVATSIVNIVRQNAVGLSYRWSPTSQTWAKLGHSEEITELSGVPVLFAEEGSAGVLGLYAKPLKQFDDVQLRHTMDLADGTRTWFGLEHVRERQYSEVAGLGPLYNADSYPFPAEALLFVGTNNIRRRYTALTGALRMQVAPQATVDGALTVNALRDRIRGENLVALLASGGSEESNANADTSPRIWTPRLGLVLRTGDGGTLRAAYQDWLRPLSVSTLGSVETAGIPLEDRLVQAGGRLKRRVAQWSWTGADDTFLSLKADYQRIDNPGTLGVDLRTPSLPFLEALRNTQLLNLASTDLLEGTPDFERGIARVLSAAVNRLLGPNLSAYAKYTYQDTDSSYEKDGTRIKGLYIPFVPRNTFVAGATFAHSSRAYVSGRVVHRSSRYEDKENLTQLPARWTMDLIAQWETSDKHLSVGAALFNLGGKKLERQPRRLVLNAQYRF
ncbi:MAG TPA: TonB-dependent receptor [Burkholderiaceae bacterium]